LECFYLWWAVFQEASSCHWFDYIIE
jgi:hypothetical protein